MVLWFHFLFWWKIDDFYMVAEQTEARVWTQRHRPCCELFPARSCTIPQFMTHRGSNTQLLPQSHSPSSEGDRQENKQHCDLGGLGRGGCCRSHREGTDLYLRLYEEVRARLNIRHCLPGEEEERGGASQEKGTAWAKAQRWERAWLCGKTQRSSKGCMWGSE